MINSLRKILDTTKLDSGLTYVAMGNLIISIIGGLFWFLLASILPTDNYGLLNYYVAIANILAIISVLGLNTTVITYIAKGLESKNNPATLHQTSLNPDARRSRYPFRIDVS